MMLLLLLFVVFELILMQHLSEAHRRGSLYFNYNYTLNLENKSIRQRKSNNHKKEREDERKQTNKQKLQGRTKDERRTYIYNKFK